MAWPQGGVSSRQGRVQGIVGFAGVYAIVLYLKWLYPLQHVSPDLGYEWEVLLSFLFGLAGLAVSVLIGFVLGWIGQRCVASDDSRPVVNSWDGC